jgi:hypothetical protein
MRVAVAQENTVNAVEVAEPDAKYPTGVFVLLD